MRWAWLELLTGCLLAAASLTAQEAAGQAGSGPWNDVPMSDNLRVGISQADITPAIGVSLGGYTGRGLSAGVHDSLEVAVAVFDDGTSRAALAALDVIMIETRGQEIKEVVSRAGGMPPDHILLNASHTHGSPWIRSEPAWFQDVLAAVGTATEEAVADLKPASIGYGEGTIDFNVSRRFVQMSGEAVGFLNPHGKVDRRVKVLRIDQGDAVAPAGLLVHVVCHPNVFRGENRHITADFFGVADTFIERNFDGATTGMLLQGATGDVRAIMPPVDGAWRNGSEADMTWVGYTLGGEAVKIATRLRVREFMRDRTSTFRITGGEEILYLDPDPAKVTDPTKTGLVGRDSLRDGKIVFPIRALAIGDILFVALPGEPVVEYGLGIEDDLSDLGMHVIVLGYASGQNGYVPVEHMIDEGGYEAEGPYYYDSESAIRDGVKRLVHSILQDEG